MTISFLSLTLIKHVWYNLFWWTTRVKIGYFTNGKVWSWVDFEDVLAPCCIYNNNFRSFYIKTCNSWFCSSFYTNRRCGNSDHCSEPSGDPLHILHNHPIVPICIFHPTNLILLNLHIATIFHNWASKCVIKFTNCICVYWVWNF